MNISIKKQSGIYTLTSKQILPISLDEAWHFFTLPKNLDKITPKDMDFRITNNPSNTTYAGQIITYKIGVFPFFKNNWITEITHLENQKFFVDEQRFGPYTMWHHEHHFEETPEGNVLMTDIVNFKLPLGLLGNLMAGWWVSNKVRYIFQSRYRILANMFQ